MANFEMLKQTSIEEFREAIERVNKISIDEMAKTISDNYNKKCCENCICAESCKKTDCEAGIKHWLESEAEEWHRMNTVKKHKRCGTCKHWTEPSLGYEYSGICEVKKADKYNTEGRFCRIYKAKEYRE